MSLNDISHDAAADLIAAVCKEGVRVTQVERHPASSAIDLQPI